MSSSSSRVAREEDGRRRPPLRLVPASSSGVAHDDDSEEARRLLQRLVMSPPIVEWNCRSVCGLLELQTIEWEGEERVIRGVLWKYWLLQLITSRGQLEQMNRQAANQRRCFVLYCRSSLYYPVPSRRGQNRSVISKRLNQTSEQAVTRMNKHASHQ